MVKKMHIERALQQVTTIINSERTLPKGWERISDQDSVFQLAKKIDQHRVIYLSLIANKSLLFSYIDHAQNKSVHYDFLADGTIITNPMYYSQTALELRTHNALFPPKSAAAELIQLAQALLDQANKDQLAGF
jgi:hypothetical protein